MRDDRGKRAGAFASAAAAVAAGIALSLGLGGWAGAGCCPILPQPEETAVKHRDKGAQLLRSNDPEDVDEAERETKLALAREPLYPAALVNLGIIYLRKGYLDEAMKQADEALALTCDNFADGSNLRGLIWLARGNSLLAEEHFKAAVDTFPGYAEAWSNLGEKIYLVQGRDAEAFDAFRQGAENGLRSKDPYDKEKGVDCREQAGLVLLKNGPTLYEDAEQQFRLVLDDRQQSVIALYGLGVIRYHAEDFKQAIDFLRRAIKAAPKPKEEKREPERAELGRKAKKLLDEVYSKTPFRFARQWLETARENIKAAKESKKAEETEEKLREATEDCESAVRICEAAPQGDEANKRKAEAYAVKASLLLTLYAYRPKDNPTALKEAEDLAYAALKKLDPTNLEAAQILTQVYVVQRRFADAERLARILVQAEKTGANYNLLAVIYMEQKEYRKAQRTLKRALEIDPDQELAKKNLQFVEAQERFKEANRLNEKGLEKAAIGKFDGEDGAEALFKSALRLDPQFALALANLSYVYYLKDQIFDARAKAEEAIQLDPDLAAGHNQLGLVLWREGNKREAAKKFEKAAELDPGDAGPWVNLGELRFEEKDLAKAEATLQQAIDRDPKNYRANALLGRVYAAQGRDGDAETAFRAAIRYDEAKIGARLDLGDLYLKLRRFKEAGEEFQKVTERAKNDPRGWEGWAKALLELKRFEEAVVCLGYAGEIYFDRRDWDKMLVIARQRERLAPENVDCLVQLGVALIGVGDFDGAVTTLRKATGIDARNLFAQFNLGFAYARRGRVGDADLAFEAYERVLQLNPRNLPAMKEELALYRGDGGDSPIDKRRAIQRCKDIIRFESDPDERKKYEQLLRELEGKGR